ncbi:hypothetical protein MYIN104542_15115 [Mycobacterium intermedium]
MTDDSGPRRRARAPDLEPISTAVPLGPHLGRSLDTLFSGIVPQVGAYRPRTGCRTAFSAHNPSDVLSGCAFRDATFPPCHRATSGRHFAVPFWPSWCLRAKPPHPRPSSATGTTYSLALAGGEAVLACRECCCLPVEWSLCRQPSDKPRESDAKLCAKSAPPYSKYPIHDAAAAKQLLRGRAFHNYQRRFPQDGTI